MRWVAGPHLAHPGDPLTLMKPIAAAFMAVLVLVTPAWPAAEEEEVNNGQDITRPLRRVDLRYQYQNLPPHENDNEHSYTIGGDLPFALAPGWTLGTRIELPRILTDAPEGDLTLGEGDLLVQALLIHTLSERWGVAAGTQLVFPTAPEDETGGGKYRIVPTAAVRASLPDLGKGVWALVIVRYDTDFAGESDRQGRKDLIVQPVLNVPLPHSLFLNVMPAIKYNLDEERPRDRGRWFIPFQVMVGWVWARKVVGSIEVGVPLIHDYQQYDVKVELRFGFFF